MANVIKIKRSSVPGKVPLTTDLEIGELALNTADGILYTKHSDGNIKQLSRTTDFANISVSGNVVVAGNVVAGAFYDTSGNAVTSLSVGIIDTNGNISNNISSVSTLRFDSDSGFDVLNLGNGVAKIAMNSTFKYWEVDGQDTLVATGLDTVEFIAGNGISITTNANSIPQALTISAHGGTRFTAGSNSPSSPIPGDKWYDTGDGILYIFVNDGNSTYWLDISTTIAGPVGATGAVGYTGSQGSNGFAGSVGAAGPIGYSGSQGIAGYSGSQGDLGYSGSAGFAGSAGLVGYAGSQGVTGYSGSQGDLGYTGSKGDAGFAGSQGIQGPLGYTGSQGIVGHTGSRGDTGYAGSQGLQGIVGYTGSKGDIGYSGSQGEAGYTGSQGIQGIVGYTGSQGTTGFVGSQGIVGGVVYTVTNSGASDYVIAGANDPTLNLIKGFTYYFSISSPGHPFWIKTSQTTGTTNAYSSGVTNNGVDSGLITFTVPWDAPSTLYYICQFHGVMSGTINVLESAQGYNGSAGANGFTGSRGDTGFVGSQGLLGYSGSQGQTGFVGSAGVNGFTGSQGNTGLGFTIARTYASVSALASDITPTGIVPGQFALIETGDVENPENSRLYLWNGSVYTYVNDLSGAAGITGPQGTAGFTGSAGTNGFAGSAGSVGFTGSSGSAGFSGSNGYTGSAGALTNWIKRTTNYSAVTGDRIIADTSSGSFVVSLPSGPGLGAYVKITDGYNFSANSLTVDRNGSTIENLSSNVIVDVSSVDLEFIYDGSTWQIVSTTGPQGYTGYTGSSGLAGYTGSSGMGYAGSTGSTGYTGSQGNLGYTGSVGSTGYTGSVGAQGNDGYTGSQGVMGYSGSRGNDGFVGSSGTEGAAGATGALGYTGSQGAGFTGSAGSAGFAGSSGLSGATGPQGPAGVTTSGTTVDTFTGNGVQTVFSLSVIPFNENETTVNIDGVIQLRSSYSLANNVLTFDEAPAPGAEVEVTTRVYGTNSFVTRSFTGNGVQTTFTVTSGVSADSVIVTENGIVQRPNVDYTVTGSTLTAATAPAGNVVYQIREIPTASIGATGAFGYTGSQGAGFTGSAGTNGFTGSAGTNGFAGSAGFTGSVGSTAIQESNTAPVNTEILWLDPNDTVATTTTSDSISPFMLMGG